MFTGWSLVVFCYDNAARLTVSDKLSLSPVMTLKLDKPYFCLLLLPVTHCCFWLFQMILPMPPRLITMLGDGISCLVHSLCSPYLSDMCLLASVLYSLRGLFIVLPAESSTTAWIHQGAHSCEEPVSQNKSITIYWISVTERITYRIHIIGLLMRWITYISFTSRFKESQILWGATAGNFHRQYWWLSASLLSPSGILSPQETITKGLQMWAWTALVLLL